MGTDRDSVMYRLLGEGFLFTLMNLILGAYSSGLALTCFIISSMILGWEKRSLRLAVLRVLTCAGEGVWV